MNPYRHPQFNSCAIAQSLCEVEILSPELLEQLDGIVDYSTPALRINYLTSVIEKNDSDTSNTGKQ